MKHNERLRSRLLWKGAQSESLCVAKQISDSLWKGTASAVPLSTCKMDGFSR
jgi:hypothetical protein